MPTSTTTMPSSGVAVNDSVRTRRYVSSRDRTTGIQSHVMRRSPALTVVAFALLISTMLGADRTSGQSLAFRVVVVEGEHAVNVIQQKTATAPIVEVRDKNDQPVAGVNVTFAIRGGRAAFSGART